MKKLFTLGLLAAIAAIGLFGGGHADAALMTYEESLPLIGIGGLIVNAANLDRLYTGFKTAFNEGLGAAESLWMRIATTVPSTTKEEKYGWLGKVPNMREWIGDRVVQNLMAHDYAIKNKKFELTIGVGRDDIEDDQYGVYAPLFKAMGESVAAHPEQLVWDLLKAGFASPCYDGQYFFDTDHPVLDANGAPASVANTDGGAGTPWFLIDDRRVLKPIIFQERRKADFVPKTKPDDDNVFDRDEYVYGSSARYAVGFGFWQFAWGSKQDLSKANYGTARAALMGMKGDHGRPLGISPRVLVVPPSLEAKGLEILNAERDANGATNVYRGTAELLVVPWLA